MDGYRRWTVRSQGALVMLAAAMAAAGAALSAPKVHGVPPPPPGSIVPDLTGKRIVVSAPLGSAITAVEVDVVSQPSAGTSSDETFQGHVKGQPNSSASGRITWVGPGALYNIKFGYGGWNFSGSCWQDQSGQVLVLGDYYFSVLRPGPHGTKVRVKGPSYRFFAQIIQ